MSQTETQHQTILHDLKKGKGITPMDALQDHGCFRLASRIHELRSRGWPIVTERTKSENNPHITFATYYLENDKTKWPE